MDDGGEDERREDMDGEGDDLVDGVEDERVAPGGDSSATEVRGGQIVALTMKLGDDVRSEGPESQSVTSLEEVGVSRKDPKLLVSGRQGQRGLGRRSRSEEAHVNEDEGVDGVAAVLQSSI
jgi:hypothetical protein